jgi:hypothetical protein
VRAQLLTLIAVILGAALSWGAATLTERSRHKREQHVHWRNRRLDAYSVFAAATKSYMSTLFRVGASLTVDDQTERLALDEATPLLVEAFREREKAFEQILLVGSTQVADTARQWVKSIYAMRDALDEERLTRDRWQELVHETNKHRASFHEQARADLGLH